MCDTRVQRIEAFGAALSVQDWGHITKQNDVNKSYEGFVNIFNELYGIHCLLKRCASEIKEKNRPWFIKVWQMRVKRKTICTKNTLNVKQCMPRINVKKYKNKLTNILRYAEKEYYSNLLEKHLNNTKRTWKVLNSVIKRNRNCTPFPFCN